MQFQGVRSETMEGRYLYSSCRFGQTGGLTTDAKLGEVVTATSKCDGCLDCDPPPVPHGAPSNLRISNFGMPVLDL